MTLVRTEARFSHIVGVVKADWGVPIEPTVTILWSQSFDMQV